MARLLNFARVLTADRIDSRAMRVVIDCREFSKAHRGKAGRLLQMRSPKDATTIRCNSIPKNVHANVLEML